MLTKISKGVLLANVAFSTILFAWALALYGTHTDPNEAVDTTHPEKLKVVDEVKQLNAEINVAQSGFIRQNDAVGDAEASYDKFAGALQKKLEEADTGKFYEMYERVKPGEDAGGSIARSGKLNLDAKTTVKLSDGTDLKGVEVYRTAFATSTKRAKDSRAKLATDAKTHNALSDEIVNPVTGYTARYDRFKRMFAELSSEKDHLADELVGWEDQLTSSERRNRQLVDRLDGLKKPLSLVPPQTIPTNNRR